MRVTLVHFDYISLYLEFQGQPGHPGSKGFAGLPGINGKPGLKVRDICLKKMFRYVWPILGRTRTSGALLRAGGL